MVVTEKEVLYSSVSALTIKVNKFSYFRVKLKRTRLEL